MGKVFTITEGLVNMGALRSGGQGSVYKGKRIGEIYVAVKLLPTPIYAENEEDKNFKDFMNEVGKLKKVNENPSPNVVKILNSGITESGSLPFIEMEFIEGPDLAELLLEPRPPVFKVPELIKVADQLANALSACHAASVNHGDIKSNNVKFNINTGNYILIDFGLAIMTNEQRRSSLRTAGAVEFMAPEQHEGIMLPQSDIYSYGVILYELLAGVVPFPLSDNGQSARNHVMISHSEKQVPGVLALRKRNLPHYWSDEEKEREMQVPYWLLKLIEKCLQKEPENRFANGIELHQAILLQNSALTTKSDIEGALILQNENERLQNLLAEADKRENLYQAQLNERKDLLVNKEKELLSTRKKNAPVQKAAKAAMVLVALLFLALGALGGYMIFGNKPEKVMKYTIAAPVKKSDVVKTADTAYKVSALPDKPILAVRHHVKADTFRPQRVLVRPRKLSVKPPPVVELSKKRSDVGKVFTVFNTYAYFHDRPDASSIRRANINRWNNARLKALDDQNGYIYVSYRNDQGQVSSGWLDKNDLVVIGN